jgi:sugar transferase (PEP-CTERM/EpsH1 system associated)
MSSILFIAHRFPYPPDRGENIRGWNIIRHMAETNRVFLAAISDDPRDAEHEAPLRAVCAGMARFPVVKRRQKLRATLRARPGRPLMLDYYRSPEMHAWVNNVIAREGIDIVYIFSTAMAPYALRTRGKRLILDMQDVDSQKWAQYAAKTRGAASLVWAREARTLLQYERRAAAACESTLLVTEAEAARFAELAPESARKIGFLEQGVDLDKFAPDQLHPSPYDSPGPWLSFTGNMDYWPNAEAAVWFARMVLPLVRERVPAASFSVVGANPSADVTALAELPGVIVTGRVEDVRPYVKHASVSVAPLQMARGVQNKVLEAMALGVPVVATPPAFEGIDAQPGRDLLVAASAQDMATAIVEVLQRGHPGLSAAGRRRVEERYGWPAILKKLDSILAETPVAS